MFHKIKSNNSLQNNWYLCEMSQFDRFFTSWVDLIGSLLVLTDLKMFQFFGVLGLTIKPVKPIGVVFKTLKTSIIDVQTHE